MNRWWTVSDNVPGVSRNSTSSSRRPWSSVRIARAAAGWISSVGASTNGLTIEGRGPGCDGGGGETVVNFDVDLVDLGFMDAALELMSDPSVVIVIGSKRSPGSEDRRPAARRVVTWAFSAVLRHGFGLKASDTHGLKALRREPLVPIVERCRSGSDIFDTELVLRTERAGLSLRELPVTVSDLRPPRTAIASRIPRTLIGLGALWLSMRRDP